MNLKPAHDRLLIEADVEAKNSYRLTDNVTIRLERNIENYNGRETNAVQGIVTNGEGLPERVEVLVDHNSLHPTNLINNHGMILPMHHNLYSVPKSECFCYREVKTNKQDCAVFYGDWMPFEGFMIVARVYEPYTGLIVGMEPTELKNRLFVLEGEHKHKVLHTGKWCDYEIIFQNEMGREDSLIRMRNNSDEVEAISHSLTNHVFQGTLLIGKKASTATTFELYLKNK